MARKISTDGNTFPLVSTRLLPPHLPARSITRERLLARLNHDGLRGGILAVVTAPAGYGKSTLLSQSINRYREAGWTTAWLNLEDNDNNEEEFLRYLAEIVFQLVSRVPQASKVARAGDRRSLSGASLVSELINSIRLTDQHFVLFLDDYHVIHENHIHKVVQNLVMHLPDNLNLIVGSRSQLPFPLAKLRANNSLVSIEIDDLRFNLNEASHLFHNTNRLDIESAQLEQLYQRTGGWPAVMQLAAISFRDTDDRLRFIDSFSGSTGPVSEFLVEEVIDQLPEDFAAFLIRSAITERLCYPLCKVITENNKYSSELRVIGSDRFLIQQLDNEGYWYRYHSLFRNFLLKQLDLKFQDEKQELHRRASRWYEEQGMIAEATQHAISGDDKIHALALLEEQGMRFVNHGHLSLLLSLIRRLPGNFIHGSLEILIQLAWVEVLNNHVRQARNLLQEIKEILIKQDVTSEEEWMKVHALEVPICFFEDDHIEGEKLVNDWLHKAPESSILAASLSVMSSYIHLNRFQYEKSIEVTRWLLEPSDQLEFAYSHSFAACAHGLTYIYRGLPKRTLSCLGDAMDWLGEHVSSSSQTINVLKPLQAVCRYQMGELQSASQLIDEGLSALNALAAPDHFLAAVPVRALLLNATEGYQQSLDYLLETKLLAEERNWRRLESCVLHERVRLYISIDGIDQARAIYEQAIRKLQLYTSDSSPQSSQSREWLRMAEARITLAEGDISPAQSIIGDLLHELRHQQRNLRNMELLVLMAKCDVAAGDMEKARQHLTEALLLDEEHSIIQMFRDEGEDVLKVLISMHEDGKQELEAASNKAIQERLKRILEPVYMASGNTSNIRNAGPETTRPSGYQSLIESLTKRELATMEKVVEGYSNKEIADSLYVSVNTIKSHIYSSFSKLGVSRRTQAVRRLKELGMFR